MRPEWRTETVVGLCLAMRETRDYSACPILADALQEIHQFPDDSEMLATLCDPASPFWRLERIVAMCYSAETEAAAIYLHRFAERVGYSYEKVIEGVREYATTGLQYKGNGGHDFENDDYSAAWAAQGAFWPEDSTNFEYDQKLLNEFFTAYELATGTRVPGEHRISNPFTCPC